MPYLVAAVIIVAALCLLNLLLTFGVIRRLRREEGCTPALEETLILPVGAKVPEFTAVTTAGDPVSRTNLSGRT